MTFPPPARPEVDRGDAELTGIRLDAASLRVLAHPLRSRLLSQLRIGGPATATDLAAGAGHELRRDVLPPAQARVGRAGRRHRRGRGQAPAVEGRDRLPLLLPERLRGRRGLRDRPQLARPRLRAPLHRAGRAVGRRRPAGRPTGRTPAAAATTWCCSPAGSSSAMRDEIGEVVGRYRRVGQGNPDARRIAVYLFAYALDLDRAPRRSERLRTSPARTRRAPLLPAHDHPVAAGRASSSASSSSCRPTAASRSPRQPRSARSWASPASSSSCRRAASRMPSAAGRCYLTAAVINVVAIMAYAVAQTLLGVRRRGRPDGRVPGAGLRPARGVVRRHRARERAGRRRRPPALPRRGPSSVPRSPSVPCSPACSSGGTRPPPSSASRTGRRWTPPSGCRRASASCTSSRRASLMREPRPAPGSERTRIAHALSEARQTPGVILGGLRLLGTQPRAARAGHRRGLLVDRDDHLRVTHAAAARGARRLRAARPAPSSAPSRRPGGASSPSGPGWRGPAGPTRRRAGRHARPGPQRPGRGRHGPGHRAGGARRRLPVHLLDARHERARPTPPCSTARRRRRTARPSCR